LSTFKLGVSDQKSDFRGMPRQEKKLEFSKTYILISILLTVILAGWIDGNFLGCYKFLDAKINMSWVEAQHECEVVGGYLAEPVTTG